MDWCAIIRINHIRSLILSPAAGFGRGWRYGEDDIRQETLDGRV